MKLLNLIGFDANYSKRIFGLDILRALAILFVVIGHGIKILPKENLVRTISTYLDFDGVSIFFVLSGFLIGGILIKTLETKKITFKVLLNFWIRRWMRTLPNYYFVLFLLIIVLPLIFNGEIEDSLFSKFQYVLFIQNFNTNHPYFFSEAWSLSIEEWFYLIIPLMIFLFIFLFKIDQQKSILIVAIAILLSVTLYRYFKYTDMLIINRKDWDLLLRKQVLTRLDSLMYGILIAYSIRKQKIWINYKTECLILGLALFLIDRFIFVYTNANDYGLYMCVFSFCTSSLATLLVIPFLNELKFGRGPLYGFLTIICLTSYSMYLLNLTVIQVYFINLFPDDLNQLTYIRYLAYWIMLIVFSLLMYKYVELPFMKLRDKVKIT